jgi:phage tail protein X
MPRTILLLALVVLITAAIYIIKDIYTAEPVTVAATDDVGRIWLSLDDWHWHEETIDCVSYTVGFGDTLWGIVERYYPDAHTGEMVWAIRVANDLTGSSGPVLQVGQKIWIPDPMMYGVGRE